MPNSSVYSASKAAILSLVKTLSGEFTRHPPECRESWTDRNTDLRHVMTKNSKAALDLTQQIPTRRFGSPGEIAAAIVFLSSDEATFTVGSELVIDGGMSTLLRPPCRVGSMPVK
jgi:NAD(P)-dependent dehydrogenase (short-subunit alcohol dehydrogenase family)